MDTFGKRQRERDKREKRMSKLARKRERAEIKKQQAESGASPTQESATEQELPSENPPESSSL